MSEDVEFSLASGEDGIAVEADVAEEFDLFAKEFPTDLFEGVEEGLGFVFGGEIKQNADAGAFNPSVDRFDRGVGVGDTGGVGSDDDNDFLGQFHEGHDFVVETSGGVEDEDVGRGLQVRGVGRGTFPCVWGRRA